MYLLANLRQWWEVMTATLDHCTSPHYLSGVDYCLLSWGGKWTWDNFNFESNDDTTSLKWLHHGICEGTICWATDGSHIPKRGPTINGAAWVVSDTRYHHPQDYGMFIHRDISNHELLLGWNRSVLDSHLYQSSLWTLLIRLQVSWDLLQQWDDAHRSSGSSKTSFHWHGKCECVPWDPGNY